MEGVMALGTATIMDWRRKESKVNGWSAIFKNGAESSANKKGIYEIPITLVTITLGRK